MGAPRDTSAKFRTSIAVTLAACVRQSVAARIAHHDLGDVRFVPPGEYSLYRSKLSVDPTPTSAQRA
jgi:hypothetical protein